MKIRLATKEDIPQVIELMQKASERTKEWAVEKAEKFIDDKKKIRWLIVAEDGGKLIGYVGFKKEDEGEVARKFVNTGNLSHVTWIAVLPEYRKRKIGSKLLKACDKYAIKFKKSGIWLGCRESKKLFYESNDYKDVGSYKDRGKPSFIFVKELEGKK